MHHTMAMGLRANRTIAAWALAVLALWSMGCLQPRNVADPGPDAGTSPARADARGQDLPASIDDPSSEPMGPASDPSCAGSGFHSCNGVCVDSKLPQNCGFACDPCQEITGG